MIIEIKRGNGVTEYKWRDLKDILLLLSVIVPIVFGFIFIFQLLELGIVFLIYWGCAYGWLLLFIYANSRDRHAGKQKRSRKR